MLIVAVRHQMASVRAQFDQANSLVVADTGASESLGLLRVERAFEAAEATARALASFDPTVSAQRDSFRARLGQMAQQLSAAQEAITDFERGPRQGGVD